MTFPFEVDFDEVRSNLDAFVDTVFECLESEFLVMPKGAGFVEFPAFEEGYEALKRATGSFRNVTPARVTPVDHRVDPGSKSLPASPDAASACAGRT